jgi:hypothetical protein
MDVLYAIRGICAAIAPIVVRPSEVWRDGVASVLVAFLWSGRRLVRREGVPLLVADLVHLLVSLR